MLKFWMPHNCEAFWRKGTAWISKKRKCWRLNIKMHVWTTWGGWKTARVYVIQGRWLIFHLIPKPTFPALVLPDPSPSFNPTHNSQLCKPVANSVGGLNVPMDPFSRRRWKTWITFMPEAAEASITTLPCTPTIITGNHWSGFPPWLEGESF